MFKLFNSTASLESYDYATEINATTVHNYDIKGDDVLIAIIDTGCADHDLLRDKIIGGKNFTQEGSESDYTDFNGHGTHVAGIIAASENNYFKSIAPNSKLLILKALDSNGQGSMQSILSAIRYAIDYKVDIINMSLGSRKGSDDLHEIIKEAIDKNISVVCASGNSGDDNPNTDELDFPGSYEEVIEVGAVDSNRNVSIFSNSNKYVDIVAPGENIMSTYLDNNFKSLTGTSMATPIISGSLALLLQWSKKEFKRRLPEKELYSLLIKNTKSLKIDRSAQGNGYIYIDLFK